ncbi:hypothetical protein ABFA07_002220 [Porites harrisoni]
MKVLNLCHMQVPQTVLCHKQGLHQNQLQAVTNIIIINIITPWILPYKVWQFLLIRAYFDEVRTSEVSTTVTF